MMFRWWPWHEAHKEAEQDLLRSQERLERVRGQWPAVQRAAEVMDEHRERNGFAEAIRSAMGVGR